MRQKIFLSIFLLYLLGFFAHASYIKKTVYGDGIFYFSWLHSIVVDHDVSFKNEYTHFDVTQPMTRLGILGNKYSIGPALLWSPLYVTTHILVRGDGYGIPYQIAAGITTVLLVVFSLVLLYSLIPLSSSTLVLVALATNLLFYGSLDSVNSHGVSFFAATVFLCFLSKKYINGFLVGVALGLMAMIRLQDLVYGLLLLPPLLHTENRFVLVRMFLIGFSVLFVWQLFSWYSVFGTLFNPYLLGGERFSLFHMHIPEVLFSKNNGLFLWTPVVFLGVLGWFWKKTIRWDYVSIFVLELVLVSSWSTWWQGASFSGRMFVSTLPLVSFGLQKFFTGFHSVRLSLLFCVFFCLLNIFLIGIFLIHT